MAGFSSLGIGSGLNVDSIITQTMKLERRPLDLLQAKINGTSTQISSYGQIKSAMSALYDAAKGLTDLDTWRSKQFTTGDKSFVTGSVTSAATAAGFSLEVNRLAKAQSLASGSFASGTTMGADGQITLQKGRWDAAGTSFAADSSGAVNISIAATDTLGDVAAKITQSGAGITAVVVKDGQGERLLVRSTETGEENGFSMAASGGGALAGLDGQAMALTKAVDAEFAINGMTVTSASNTVKEVVPGVTLNLLKTTPAGAPVDISVGSDKDAIKGKLKSFQEAFNKLNSLLRNLTAYDKDNKTSQPLQGDSTVRSLQSAMSSLMQQSGLDGATLASLGLEMKLDSSFKNPTLSLDDSKLDAALNDLPKLERVLTGDGVTDGLITRIRDFAFAANGVNGDITTRTKGLEALKKSNESAVEAMELRLTQREQNLLKQYQALDAKMAGTSSLSSFLSAQIGQWNK
jgi:flagellar hook-associated protein 2